MKQMATSTFIIALQGPSVLEIVDCLVRQLKESVMQENPAESSATMADEKLFQAALIGALAEFAYHLPDYQKIEIMMFILGRSPGIAKVSHENKPGETFIQHMLLKCLLEVCNNFVMCDQFLQPLSCKGREQIPDDQLFHSSSIKFSRTSSSHCFEQRCRCPRSGPRNFTMYARPPRKSCEANNTKVT